MNYEGFLEWLKTEKNMSERSTRDTVSRIKRALRIISKDSVETSTIEKLNASPEFLKLSMFIKSQLRRAVALYQEFEK